MAVTEDNHKPHKETKPVPPPMNTPHDGLCSPETSNLIECLDANNYLPAWAATGFRTSNCRQVRVTWSTDREDVPSYIQSLFSDIGTLEYVGEPYQIPSPENLYAKWIVFAEDGAAEVSAKTHNRRQEFLNGDKLGVQVCSQIDIWVPFAAYQDIQQRLAEILASWKDDVEPSSLEVHITSTKTDFNSGSKYQSNKEHVTKPYVKLLLESDLLGDFVCITLAGTSKKTLVKAASSLQTIFDADAARCEAVGNVNSQRKHGQDILQAGDAVENVNSQRKHKQDILQASDAVEIQPKCSVCGELPAKETNLECCHSYCLECLEGLCIWSTDTTNREGRVECQNDSPVMCQAVPSLEELQRLLPSDKFEEILATSFNAHIRREVMKYGHCSTPDCSHIYAKIEQDDQHGVPATNERAPAFACEGCLEVLCLLCHRQHRGITCAELDFESSGERKALEAFKKQAGIKDCRNCGTSIETTYGCNHMTCAGCSSHICWVCDEVFSNAMECVDHLTARHGNFDNGNGAAVDNNAEDVESEDEEEDGEDWRERLGWLPEHWAPAPRWP